MYDFTNEETFQEVYEELSRYDIDRWINPFWVDNLEKIYNVVKYGITPNFGLNPNFYGFTTTDSHDVRPAVQWMRDNMSQEIFKAMFVSEPSWGGFLKLPLSNDGVRDNQRMLRDLGIHATPTSIFHMRAFACYMKVMGRDIRDYNSIVHWGGGYGNQTRLIRLVNPDATEYIIDLPLISMVQSAYLVHVLPPEQADRINFLVMPDDEVKEGHINLVPLPHIDKVPDNAEWFISTHALSESSAASMRYVAKERNWFGADHLLLAWMEDHPHFPDGDYWMEIVKSLPLTELTFTDHYAR